jgi:hypothetical protein
VIRPTRREARLPPDFSAAALINAIEILFRRDSELVDEARAKANTR